MNVLSALGFFLAGVIVTLIAFALLYSWIVGHLFPDKDVIGAIKERWANRTIDG